MVTHFLTGRPALGTVWPPYGAPFERAELDGLVDRWPGRVYFLLEHDRRAWAEQAGLWTVADHPLARPVEPAGEGFTVWTVDPPSWVR